MRIPFRHNITPRFVLALIETDPFNMVVPIGRHANLTLAKLGIHTTGDSGK